MPNTMTKTEVLDYIEYHIGIRLQPHGHFSKVRRRAGHYWFSVHMRDNNFGDRNWVMLESYARRSNIIDKVSVGGAAIVNIVCVENLKIKNK